MVVGELEPEDKCSNPDHNKPTEPENKVRKGEKETDRQSKCSSDNASTHKKF